MQIRRVRRSIIFLQENSIMSISFFETVNKDSKRHCFIAKVGPRGFCVFYELKRSATESSSFSNCDVIK
jgi:hypothetical protein